MPHVPDVLWFDDPGTIDVSRSGGKGSNLAVLTQAGLSVPPGFVVGADAYARFLTEAGLAPRIAELLSEIDYADPDGLEATTAQARELVLAAEMPSGLAAAIREAYAALGDEVFVAVRSSGTMEDSAEASYAGLHDTFLDVRGGEEVVAAVRRCYASLWTARATSYRHTNGIDHFQAPIAAVVQRMIASEVAGVMLTANPLTTETDELVIDASYGLGEAVVASLVTPDQFVVKLHTLKVKDRSLGAKEVKVVRAPNGEATGEEGTVTVTVADADSARYCLDDEQVAELAALGRQVMEHYDGLPQDIEWGYAGGAFYLLQARPLTGVEFSWDADIDQRLWDTANDDEYYWTRDMSDENWTGAITPLMYSWRGPSWVAGHAPAARLWGHDDLGRMRFFKYHKSTAYYNCSLEKEILERTMPPAIRVLHQSGFAKLPPEWREETASKPLSWLEWLKIYARVETLAPQLYEGFRLHENDMSDPQRLAESKGLPDEELRKLSDSQLKHHIEFLIWWEDRYNWEKWTWFFVNARDMFTILTYMIMNWYQGDPQEALGGLLTGVANRTKTLEMNHGLWELSEIIRHSPELLEAFKAHPGAEFFTVTGEMEAGRALHAKYAEFLSAFGHRGHADRDIYFPRRLDDPSLDYDALTAMLSDALSDGYDPSVEREDPLVKEQALTAHREEVTDEVIENIKRRPFGSLRAELFKLVLAYCHRFVEARDNERHFIDYATYSNRRSWLEVNRRLLERGLVHTDRDFWFLSKEELWDLVEGRANRRLARAKIAARMRDFDRFLAGERPAPYLHRGQELDLDAVQHEGNVLQGLGTARGKVTGVARVAKVLKDIGRVKRGEILITTATDPGWTPVFSLIGGIVLETGGLTAHGSMLAREYGLPAAQIAGATKLIPDGAMIEVDGNRGSVILLDGEPATDAFGNGRAPTNGASAAQREAASPAGRS
jgi:rifampicin phosphotransferase